MYERTCVMHNAAVLFPEEDECVANYFCVEQFVLFRIGKQVKEALFSVVAVPNQSR